MAPTSITRRSKLVGADGIEIMRLGTRLGRVRTRIARVGSRVSPRVFKNLWKPPRFGSTSGHDGVIPLICTEWNIHPIWLGIEPPNRVPHANGFSSVISDTLKYRPAILSRQKLSQNLFKIISHAVAHKTLALSFRPFYNPSRRGLYALLHSLLPSHPSHNVIRCVLTQPELNGER